MTRGRRGYHAYITPPRPPPPNPWRAQSIPPFSAAGPHGDGGGPREEDGGGAREDGGERRRSQGGGAARGNEREVGFDSKNAPREVGHTYPQLPQIWPQDVSWAAPRWPQDQNAPTWHRSDVCVFFGEDPRGAFLDHLTKHTRTKAKNARGMDVRAMAMPKMLPIWIQDGPRGAKTAPGGAQLPECESNVRSPR